MSLYTIFYVYIKFVYRGFVYIWILYKSDYYDGFIMFLRSPFVVRLVFRVLIII